MVESLAMLALLLICAAISFGSSPCFAGGVEHYSTAKDCPKGTFAQYTNQYKHLGLGYSCIQPRQQCSGCDPSQEEVGRAEHGSYLSSGPGECPHSIIDGYRAVCTGVGQRACHVLVKSC